MAPHEPPAERRDDHNGPQGDPWNAFGYLVAGVLVYGLVGYALDRWWGTSFLVAVGIVVGAALGLYQTYKRFEITEPPAAPPDDPAAPRERGEQT